jgi:hypothetical protein
LQVSIRRSPRRRNDLPPPPPRCRQCKISLKNDQTTTTTTKTLIIITAYDFDDGRSHLASATQSHDSPSPVLVQVSLFMQPWLVVTHRAATSTSRFIIFAAMMLLLVTVSSATGFQRLLLHRTCERGAAAASKERASVTHSGSCF